MLNFPHLAEAADADDVEEVEHAALDVEVGLGVVLFGLGLRENGFFLEHDVVEEADLLGLFLL